MTGQGMPDLWERALKKIKRKVSRQVFETWFQPTAFSSMNEELLVVIVPSPVFRDVFQEKYSYLIEEVLEDLTDKRMSVSFLVAQDFHATPFDTHSLPGGNGLNGASKCFGSNQLNPKYTFGNFVVGGSNQFAHAASLAVAQAFNKMALGDDLSGKVTIGAALILFAGHALNIVLGAMGVMVHGIRLNTLEFSGHAGVEWAGIHFNPFRKTNEDI